MDMTPDDDFKLLARRIGELKSTVHMRGLILTEPLLPRQTLRLDAIPDAFADVVRECHAANRTIGIVGSDENGIPLRRGVEATITAFDRECNDSGYGDPYVYSAMLKGSRIFEFADDASTLPEFCFSSDVRIVDLGLSDQLSAAQSPSRVVHLASRELTLLVNQWEELARGGGVTLWGKPRGAQAADDAAELDEAVTGLLRSLGDIPSLEFPSERALWVAALVTAGRVGALPAMANVRPAILTANTPLQRLSVAKTGMVEAIYRMKGGKWPIDTFYWQ